MKRIETIKEETILHFEDKMIILEKGDKIEIIKESKLQEADVSKIIKDLGDNFGGSNEEQMKATQLLKGLATSDDPKANEFMKKLDKATTKISKEMSESNIKESAGDWSATERVIMNSEIAVDTLKNILTAAGHNILPFGTDRKLLANYMAGVLEGSIK